MVAVAREKLVMQRTNRRDDGRDGFTARIICRLKRELIPQVLNVNHIGRGSACERAPKFAGQPAIRLNALDLDTFNIFAPRIQGIRIFVEIGKGADAMPALY